MNAALLAAGDLGDVAEVVIILLIIAGSVLGPIVKGLIKWFGGGDSNETIKRSAGGSEEPRPTPARPVHPPARPMPVRPAAQPPAAQVRPAKPVERMPSREWAATPVVRPVARPTAARPAVRRPAVPAAPVRPTPMAPAVEHDRPEYDLSERHLAELDSEVAERHINVTMPSDGVTHPSTEELHEDAAAAEGGGAEICAIRRPNRAALRRAIIMNEVLGPPLALRGGDDRF